MFFSALLFALPEERAHNPALAAVELALDQALLG
jgi:hypothetical protein